MSQIWVEVLIDSQPWKGIKIETKPGWIVRDIVNEAKDRFKLLDSDGSYGLRTDKRVIPSSLPVRASGLITSQKLFLYKAEDGIVKVRLILTASDSVEFSSSFECGCTIWDILLKFPELRGYTDSIQTHPERGIACLIVGKMLKSFEQLKKTTLRDLGCSEGSVSIRLILESEEATKGRTQDTFCNAAGGKDSLETSCSPLPENLHAPEERDTKKGINSPNVSLSTFTPSEIEKILSSQPENRNIRVFKIKENLHILHEVYDSSFYELTVEDARNLMQQQKIMSSIVGPNVIVSEEAKREKFLRSKLDNPLITIRMKLANYHAIQADFNIMEPASRLYDFVREYTTVGKDSDFKLIFPPDTVLVEDSTLLDSGIRSNTCVGFNRGVLPAISPDFSGDVTEVESGINLSRANAAGCQGTGDNSLKSTSVNPPSGTVTRVNDFSSKAEIDSTSKTRTSSTSKLKRTKMPTWFRAIKK